MAIGVVGSRFAANPSRGVFSEEEFGEPMKIIGAECAVAEKIRATTPAVTHGCAIGVAGAGNSAKLDESKTPTSVTIHLSSGLGNQIFIYSFYRLLQEKLGNDRAFLRPMAMMSHSAAGHARPFQLDRFRTKIAYAKKHEQNSVRLTWPKLNYGSDEIIGKLFTQQRPYEIVNCFEWVAGLRCLTEIIDMLRDEFEPKDQLGSANEKILERIAAATEPVSVHVRRGDYLVPPYNKWFKTLPVEYYKGAEKFICERVENPTFFVFSDDIEWAKKNLKFDYPSVFVDINGEADGWKDFVLMKNCRHHITANSSFSTYAAVLAKNPEKIVVSPWKFDGGYDGIFWKECACVCNDGTIAASKS
ncbi:MAG: alpha-1,2-fucosyltransferase [Puniceicoccales bacterium]|jgi:hypothetical protein|nr:alpha-1,2-fucosyltransferase [Puniceicoccales bacterium]